VSNENNDVDWQNFENQAESIIRKSSDSIRDLKEKSFSNVPNDQYREHLKNLFVLLEGYLKGKQSAKKYSCSEKVYLS